MARYGLLDVALPLSIVFVVGTFAISSFWWYDIGEISDKYTTSVTPEGYAFSIWGLIWFTQSAAVIWLLIRNDESAESKKAIVASIAPWWAFGAVFEVVWLIFYGQETKRGFTVSAVALVYGAFCFIQALFTLNGTAPSRFSFSARAVAAAGSAMNGAWLSVASCIGILTVVPAPNEQTELGLAVLALCAGAGVVVSLKTCSTVYPLVLVWALVAVVLVDDRESIIRIGAVAGICVSGVAAFVAAVRRVLAPKTASEDGSAPGAQYMTRIGV